MQAAFHSRQQQFTPYHSFCCTPHTLLQEAEKSGGGNIPPFANTKEIQKVGVHIVYYTMFTLWKKPPLRTLALQPGKCDAALHRVKKVVPSRIVASPSYTISTPHKPQPSPISPLFTSAQDATCTPAATSKQ